MWKKEDTVPILFPEALDHRDGVPLGVPADRNVAHARDLLLPLDYGPAEGLEFRDGFVDVLDLYVVHWDLIRSLPLVHTPVNTRPDRRPLIVYGDGLDEPVVYRPHRGVGDLPPEELSVELLQLLDVVGWYLEVHDGCVYHPFTSPIFHRIP